MIVNEFFGPVISEFDFTVPFNYDLKDFAFNEKIKIFHDDESTRAISARMGKLILGKIYSVIIFPFIQHIQPIECLDFAMQNKFILVGGQCMEILPKEKFPKNRAIISFEDKDNLWMMSLERPIPTRKSAEEYWNNLFLFGSDWPENLSIVYFKEK